MISSDNGVMVKIDKRLLSLSPDNSKEWNVKSPLENVSNYGERYMKLDPIFKPSIAFLKTNLKSFVVTREEIVPKYKLKDTEFYSDFLKPLNVSASISLMIKAQNGSPTTFGFSRLEGTRNFHGREKAILSFLAPQIAKTLSLCTFKEKWFEHNKTAFHGSTIPESSKVLTQRELEIAWHVARGYENKEIGDRLFISSVTVRDHLKSIFRKMRIRSRSQLASKMLIEGLN